MDLGSIIQVFSLELTTYQIYGLFFLMGTLAVSAISDLKDMAAQKEFLQIWIVFTGIMFAVDFYPGILSLNFSGGNVAKWVLILVLSLLSYSDRGIIFKLCKMDVAAIAAVSSLYNPLLVLIFFPLLKLISLGAGPLLKSGNRYPFLPVVLTGTSIILALNLYLI